MDPFEKYTRKLQQQIDESIRNTYSITIINHWKNPKNWGIMNNADGYARFTGPCGDTMEISIKVQQDKIMKCTFDTDGCGATIACGSIISDMATGRSLVSAKRIDQNEVIERCGGLPEENLHCAMLAAKTLKKSIIDYETTRGEPWKRLYHKIP